MNKESFAKIHTSGKKDYVFTNDGPIVKAKEDILGRDKFAENIANWINGLDVNNSACSIAINSPWGYGKTSFLNMIKEQIEKNDDFIILEFSPWHLSPSSDITKMFFSRLENEFKGINNRLSDFFAEYSKLLSDTDYSIVHRLFKKDKDYGVLMNDISEQLKVSGRKLAIIIDDFDRLSASEIQEVLRLIRGSANFPNFIFLTAFDKDYVQETLNESSKAISPHYIEKFFEHEYNLPIYSKEKLKDRIEGIAEQFMEEEDLRSFTEYVSQKNSLFNEGYVFEPLGNLRGIYRWMNSISVKYKVLKSECIVNDLADIELLNMLYPKIYSALEQETDTYLIAEHGNNYTLWDETKASDDSMAWFHKKSHKDLRKSKAYTSIPEEERKDLENILDRLLPKNSWRSCPKSFRDSNYTYRYFYQNLSDNDMSEKKFIEFINQPFDVVKEIIDNDEDGLYLRRIWLHSKDQKIESKEKAERLLSIIYYAMRRYGRYFEFETISKLLTTLELSNDEEKVKLNSLIRKNGFSVGIVACYSLWNPNRCQWNKYLGEDDMNEILKDMIQFAIAENLGYETIRSAHARTSKIVRRRNEKGEDKEDEVFPLTEIEEIYQIYIATSLCMIVSEFIWFDREGPRHTGKFYMSSDFTRYWPKWSDFEDFCQSHGIEIPFQNNEIKEFKTFMETYNRNSNKPVSFDFQSIKLPK